MIAIALFLQTANDWMLGPNDLALTPSTVSPYTARRKQIEARYFATPLYQREALAKRERGRSRGFEQVVWVSLAPWWRKDSLDAGTRVSGLPKGTLFAEADREILRARFLADYGRLELKAYKNLLRRLMTDPDAKRDYRLQRAALESAFLVGGDMKDGLGYAKTAEILQPDNPTTWRTMSFAHMSGILYGVGNGNENWKRYVHYTDLSRKYALASKTAAGREEARRLDIDRKWLQGYFSKTYRPDGELIRKP